MKLQEICSKKAENEESTSTELKDICAKRGYAKVIQKVWGDDDALTYNGKALFANNDLGPAYKGAIKAAEKKLEKKNDYNSSQECYLGYQPSQDLLYIGFDVWTENSDQDESEFLGILYELTGDGYSFTAREVAYVTGGFYKGVYRSKDFKDLALIDLRLD